MIESERLRYRLYTDGDKGDFIRLLTDRDVMRYVDKGVLTEKQAETLWLRMMNERYPQGVDTIWGVFAKDDGRYVGNASIRPRPEHKQDWEIGYYLMPGEWGKGLGSEIALRLTQYGFETLGLKEVFATVDPENAASIRILEKAGMSFYREEADEIGKFSVFRAAVGSA